MSSPPESDADRFGCKVIGVRQSHTCQLIPQERKGAIKLDLACYLLRYRHEEQQYLLVPDCSKDSPLFHINMHSIHPKYKSRNIFTSGHLCSSWFSVSVVLVITKKESTAYMKERIWIWLSLSEISHIWFRPQSFQNITWKDNKATHALPPPGRHSDSTRLKQDKPGTSSGQEWAARGKKALIFFFF